MVSTRKSRHAPKACCVFQVSRCRTAWSACCWPSSFIARGASRRIIPIIAREAWHGGVEGARLASLRVTFELRDEAPDAYVLRVCAAKAQAAHARRLKSERQPAPILVADTTVTLDGVI